MKLTKRPCPVCGIETYYHPECIEKLKKKEKIG